MASHAAANKSPDSTTAPTTNPAKDTRAAGYGEPRNTSRRKPEKDDVARHVGSEDLPQSEDANRINQLGGHG